jgi:hypothetical protein
LFWILTLSILTKSYGKDSIHPDFLDDYPDTKEDIDMEFPKPYGTELHSSVFFNADHAQDTVTHRSISGLLVFVWQYASDLVE